MRITPPLARVPDSRPTVDTSATRAANTGSDSDRDALAPPLRPWEGPPPDTLEALDAPFAPRAISPASAAAIRRALAGGDDQARALAAGPCLALCTPVQKAALIEQLLIGATDNRDEDAILTILRSCRGRELDAVTAELRNRGRFGQLFDDTDGRQYPQLLELLAQGLTDHDTTMAFLDRLCAGYTSRREERAMLATFTAFQRRGALAELFVAIGSGDRAERYMDELGRPPELDRLLRAAWPAGQATNLPGGRVIGPLDLTERAEHDLVTAAGGHGLLVPYGRFDPEAEPVVVVHGINGSASDLQTVIDHYTADSSCQVYVFLYDDRGRYLDRTADDLARSLEQLRSEHLLDKQPPLRIVAHSMGGIVARAALNTMVDPDWMPTHHGRTWYGEPARVRGTEPYQLAASRLAAPTVDNYASIDLITVDTPWHGFGEPAINVRNMLFWEDTLWDMVANSAVLENLHHTSLPASVSLHQLEADNAAAGLPSDKIRGWHDRSDDDLQRLQAWLAGQTDTRGWPAELRNHLAALQQDGDFDTLRAAVQAEIAAGTLDTSRLRALIRQALPVLAGGHEGVLHSPALLRELDRTFGRAMDERSGALATPGHATQSGDLNLK